MPGVGFQLKYLVFEGAIRCCFAEGAITKVLTSGWPYVIFRHGPTHLLSMN
jgi:hypothetical protein